MKTTFLVYLSILVRILKKNPNDAGLTGVPKQTSVWFYLYLLFSFFCGKHRIYTVCTVIM
jgi:hypothetical protein